MIKQSIVGFDRFQEEFFNNLKTPSCIPRHMGELCGGWTQETFKQIIQKITKKNTAPLQLWFDSWQSMDIISIKKASLKEVFKLLDTRNISRIDSCELLSVMQFVAKGDYETVLSNISQVFGFKNPSGLTKDEFFFFLDSFFRGISKILLSNKKKENQEQDVNKRLSSEDIKDITDRVYGTNLSLSSSEFAKVFQKSKVNSFFYYVYVNLQQSNDVERQISLQNLQISQEVKKAMLSIIQTIEKAAAAEKQ